jgi:hypothetical protein
MSGLSYAIATAIVFGSGMVCQYAIARIMAARREELEERRDLEERRAFLAKHT